MSAPSLEYEHVILKDGSTATIFYASHAQISHVPEEVLKQMQKCYNDVIEEGQTYPSYDLAETLEQFETVWLLKHFTILVTGKQTAIHPTSQVLGTYYVKPNYIGRCSHVCNAGFLVSTNCRGQGVGKILGKSYIQWAPKLKYTYSVFNLVFKTNEASWRIWDSLGFSRIGVVPGAARLKGFEDKIDAYIYGKSFE